MTRPFAIGRYPVTREEYLGFCLAEELPPLEDADESRWPVGEVSWRDALAYCAWLARITGEDYRLLTEAEWEYSCRAGTETHYSWNSDELDEEWACVNRDEPCTVGFYEPNPWGLYDMHGNVFEWCADPWHSSHDGRPSHGQVWLEDGDFSRRVVRGGSFYEDERRVRSSFRDGYATDCRDMVVGFRIARTLSPESVCRRSTA